MSGDVQPRKRKDKKKKKDEPSLPPFVYVKEEPAAAAPSARDGGGGSPSAASADELIHVYKESRLGGNICAKIIFFLLLGTLTVMVGLIITEHRGSSEVATAADSPWSQLLEGWIDDSPPDKHDDEHDAIADSGEHDEHDEGGDHDEDGHGHDEEHEEEQDEEHDEDHDEEHDDSDIVEQEYTARAARSVASESKVSGEEEDEGADEDNQEEEEEGDDEEEGDEDGGENEEEEEGADEDNQEDEKPDAVGSQEEEDGPEEFDEPDESEGQDDQESPQSTEETSQVGGEDEQDENDVSGEDNFVYKEIPGVTASAEDLDTGDDDSQGEVDQDEEDDISESAGKVSDAGYYSAHEDDNNDNDENDDDDDNDNDNGDREDEDEGQGDDNDTDDGDGDGDDVDEDEEAHEDNVSEINNEDSDLENNNSEENEEDEDQINISRNEDDSSERDANSFHLRGDQSPENEDNEDEKEGEENSDDPDEGFDEPVDSDDDNDDNNDNNLNEHSRNIDEYEEIERDFDTLGTSPLSEREDVSTEQHVESDDDFEEITDVPDNTESEKANEEEESLEPITSIRQPQQEPDQEISDGEEISGSEDEASPRPPPAVMRRTGGPKEINEFPEWPMGPDYPPEKPPTPREFQDLHTMEAQIEENPEAILKQVKRLLTSKPENVALLSLQAQALDKLAEIKRSNNLLEEAIKSYLSLLRMTDLSDNLFLKFANRTLNRMRFRGQYGDAIGVHKMLISRFPTDPRHRNDLAVSYLMAGRVSSAKLLLEEILRLWPSNGFALVHYGFVLKTSENDNEAGSHFLQAGINSGEPGTMDARFLFHLGDAYNRLGKNIEAGKVYELGVEKGLFRSKYQRSLYNVDRLTARPWWTLHQTTYEKELRNLEEHWKEIRNEGLAILETHSKTSAFKDEAENLRDKGVWKQLELYARGQQVASNCKRAPVTCQLISQFPAARSCRRGQAKFSVMHPNTHVWPHCGPTNCRLRAHLGLVVPVGTELRVGEEKRSWQEGKMFVFDDSFEHEVWHNGSSMRLVLIIDIWHPELTDQERRSLPAI